MEVQAEHPVLNATLLRQSFQYINNASYSEMLKSRKNTLNKSRDRRAVEIPIDGSPALSLLDSYLILSVLGLILLLIVFCLRRTHRVLKVFKTQ